MSDRGSHSIHHQQEIEAAIQRCNEQLKANPDSAEARVNLGNLYALQQQWSKAIACYRKAIHLNPEFAGAYRNLARVLMRTGKQEQAMQKWYRALTLEPDRVNAEEHYKLGQILQEKGKFTQAIECYRRAIRLKSDYFEAYQALGETLTQPDKKQAVVPPDGQTVRQNSELETISDRQECAPLHPRSSNASARDYYQMAKVLRGQGQFPEAIQCYQRAIELDPHYKLAYIDLQYIPISAEQLDPLIAFYRQMIQKPIHSPLAWGNLGDALAQKGKIGKAIRCYHQSNSQQAIATNPALAKINWKPQTKPKPDFIAIGAAKCGTTSLYQYLSEHPQIAFPHKKELNFFTVNFERGIEWYLAHFYALSDHLDFITGEATPAYFDFPVAAQRIFHCCPDVKLILLLRNPIDRAISWHYHKINTGFEKRTIQEVAALEMQKLKQFSALDFLEAGHQAPNNLLGSLYVYHLQRWMSLFPKEQILIVKSEDLYSQPSTVMEQVFDFLSLPNYQASNYSICNPGSYPPIGEELRGELVDFFRPHNQRLEAYLETQFNWDS
jgi:tetratricopeptide (TPR) repeat protein